MRMVLACSFSHCLFNPLHQHKDARNLLPCLFAAITYKVVIKTGKQLGGSTTTAQVWMTLAGNITDTGVMNIPKNENEFRFQVTLPKNFPACSAGVFQGTERPCYFQQAKFSLSRPKC